MASFLNSKFQICTQSTEHELSFHTLMQEKMEEQFIEATLNNISYTMKIGEAIKALIGLFQTTTTNHRAW